MLGLFQTPMTKFHRTLKVVASYPWVHNIQTMHWNTQRQPCYMLPFNGLQCFSEGIPTTLLLQVIPQPCPSPLTTSLLLMTSIAQLLNSPPHSNCSHLTSTSYRPSEHWSTIYQLRLTSFMSRHTKTMTNHLMNLLCMPRWMSLQIATLSTYICNPKQPLESSHRGYQALRPPSSMAHPPLHLTYWCISEGQHMNPKWESILSKGPKLQQTITCHGTNTSLIQLHGATWAK